MCLRRSGFEVKRVLILFFLSQLRMNVLSPHTQFCRFTLGAQTYGVFFQICFWSLYWLCSPQHDNIPSD